MLSGLIRDIDVVASCPAQTHAAAAKLPLDFISDGGALLHQCTKAPGAPLAACGNLAPASTGSSTLFASMRRLSPNSNRIHHRHGWRIGMALCDDQAAGGEPSHPCGTKCCTCKKCPVSNSSTPRPAAHAKPCYVMTLRDPATRLESMVRLALRARRTQGLGCTICSYTRFSWPSAQAFVADFRNASRPGHRAALKEYTSSVARPWYSHRIQTPFGGTNSLISQLDYLQSAPGTSGGDAALKGPNCDLRFVCQEEFARDWRVLVGGESDAPVVGHELRSSSNKSDSGAAEESEIRLSRLTEEAREYVRRCMYPWDAALHALVCGSRS